MERPPSKYYAPPKFVPASGHGLKSFKELVVDEPDTVFSDNLNPFRSSSRSLEQLLVEDNDPMYGDSEDLRRQREVMRQPAFQRRRDQLVRELNNLWSRSSPKYHKVRARLYDEWYQCFQSELRNRFDKFLLLLGQSETRGLRDSLQDRFDWIDHVEDELEEIRCPSEKYFDWVGKIHDWIVELVEEPQIFGSTVRRSEFKAILEKADWRMANDDSAIVNAMLLYGTEEDHPLRPNLTLGCDFESFGLQLRLNGRALAIRDTHLSTLELYGARALNPKIISGLRFDSVDLPLGGHGVEKATEKKSLIIVVLGNILSRKLSSKKAKEKEEKSDGDWDNDYINSRAGSYGHAFSTSDCEDTGFVLLLEIQKNGRPGDFYMVCNLTYIDTYGQPQVLKIEKRDIDDPLFKFCGKSAPFTVAKVDGLARSSAGSSAISSFLNAPFERACGQIQLTVMSRSAPEIVETAMCGSTLWSEGGSPPVGLYPT